LIEDLSLGDDEDDEEEEGSAAPAGMVEWATMSTYSFANGGSAQLQIIGLKCICLIHISFVFLHCY
jgi:hypothetical protein